MKVKFTDVGRLKKSWEVETKEIDYNFLYRQVKKNGALHSSDLDFYDNGTITAGGRRVGMFEVAEP
jgi:hypothetical protein